MHLHHFLWHHPSTLLRISRHFRIFHYSEFLLTDCYRIHCNPFYHFQVLSAFHSHLYIRNLAHEYPTETDIIPYPYPVLYRLQIFQPEYLTAHSYLYIQTLLHHTLYIYYPKYRIHHDVLLLRSAF